MDEPLPERLARTAERLGPTFVKGAQSLALRPDLIPTRFADAFSRLHEGVSPFPGWRAEQIVMRELGVPLGRVFEDWDDEPLAAASLSQVHRAYLRDGRPVAVKVQRPDVERVVTGDLRLLRRLARMWERLHPPGGGLRPSEVVQELSSTMHRELDFTQEAHTTHTARGNHRDDPRVVIPTVHWPLTTRRVLTLDFIGGVPPGPPGVMAAAGLDPAVLLEVGSRAIFRQVFVDGLFHADPHPGNLRMLPGNKVAFLDFGMFGTVGLRERRGMVVLLVALIERDGDGLASQLLRIGVPRADGDAAAFRRDVIDAVGSPTEQGRAPSVTHLLLEVLGAGRTHGLRFPRGLMLLARALVQLEGTAKLMAPAADLTTLMEPLMPDIAGRLLPTPTNLEEVFHHNRLAYMALLLDLPDIVAGLGIDRGRAPVQPPAANRGRWAPVALAAAAYVLARRWSG